MILRQCALGLAICAMTNQVNADTLASISLANGTDHVFTSVTVSVLDMDETLGASVDHLRPGESVTIQLSTSSCEAVDILAVYDAEKVLAAIADPCDPAIYTLTE